MEASDRIMTHASLFSGIGGFDLAAEWMGWTNVFQVEKDEWCTKVLEKNFKNTRRYGDARKFDGKEWRGSIDVLTGGFPCQPYSNSGKQQGANDDRDEWPTNFRILREIRPSFYVGENVTGIINLALEQIIFDLEGEGYVTEVFIIPASAVGGAHNRNRVWICSYTKEIGRSWLLRSVPETSPKQTESNTQTRISLDARCNPFLQFTESVGQSPILGMDDGLPHRVDRLGGLGNAIVPQIAFEIFKAIEETQNKI